ncbi:MAG: LamG-like jellyroll fold domain-containing protein, partial [Candidatus Hodarchaeales archaeon]
MSNNKIVSRNVGMSINKTYQNVTGNIRNNTLLEGLHKHSITLSVISQYTHNIERIKDIFIMEKLGLSLTKGQRKLIEELEYKSKGYPCRTQFKVEQKIEEDESVMDAMNDASYEINENKTYLTKNAPNLSTLKLPFAPEESHSRSSNFIVSVKNVEGNPSSKTSNFTRILSYIGFLAVLLFPYIFGAILFISWGNLLTESFVIPLILFPIIMVYCTFKAVYYYRNRLMRTKSETSHSWQCPEKISKLLETGKKFIKIGTCAVFSILYLRLLFFSIFSIEVLLIVSFDLIYFQAFLIKQWINKNVSTNSRKIFTVIILAMMFLSSLILLSKGNIKVVAIILPAFTLLIFITFKFNLLERRSKVLSKLLKLGKYLITGVISSLIVGYFGYTLLMISIEPVMNNLELLVSFLFPLTIIISTALYLVIKKNYIYLPLIGVFSSLWFAFYLSFELMIPKEVLAYLFFIPLLFYGFNVVILLVNNQLDKVKRLLLSITAFFIPLVLSLSIYQGFINFSLWFIPSALIVLSIISFSVSYKYISSQIDIPSYKRDSKINILYLFYLCLFICSISLCICFILAPQWQVLPVLGLIGTLVIFTVKHGTTLKPHLNAKRLRNALLIVIFFNLYTFIFGVPTISVISGPNMTFAYIDNSERIENSVEYDDLEFLPSLEDLKELSINDKFFIKCKISPVLGVSVLVSVRFIPKSVEPIKGTHIPKYYELSSQYISGPLKNYDMFTGVPINKLHLFPGVYDVEVTYTEITGFGPKIAPPNTYEITLGKDNLKVLSNERFPEPIADEYPYGAVYTFDLGDHWDVIYDGQITDSLNNPYPVKNLTLFMEVNDRYTEIAKVNTDTSGNFYLNHTVYGSIEENLLVKIEYVGDERVNPLSHEEHAGLERDINGYRFFRDKDENNYPDWPFSLYDLIDSFAELSSSEPSGSLVFMAELDDGSGTLTYDLINNRQGTLQGNTSWTSGKRDKGLSFDGDGKVISSGSGNDFKVLRGTTIISSSSATATITEGVDYTLESGQDATTSFIRITNTRLTGMGKTSGGGNQNNDDFNVRIQNPSNIATSITFERTGTSNNDRVTWEIIQYTGPSGGANEIIVRDIGTTTCSGTTQTTDGPSISTIGNVNKVVVFITGQIAVDTARSDWWESLFTAELIGSGPYTPRFTRGKSVSSNDGVSYAVVEFTGSNWANVQRLDISTECSTAWTTSNYNTAYTDVTIQSEGGTDLTNFSRTFMHQQFRTDTDSTGLDDSGDNVEIISNTQLRIRNSATSGTRNKVCWIVENLQSTGSTMEVEHGWFYKDAGGSEENAWTQTISQVNSMDTTSLFAQASMDGTGTALPRGSIDYRLTSTTQITFTESDSGQEKIVSYEVIQWPSAPPIVTYEDFDYVDFGDIMDDPIGISDSEFVVSAWAYPTILTSNESNNGVKNTFISKAGNLEIGLNETGYLQVYINTNGVETTAEYGIPGAIALNTWTFVALRYNDSNVDVFIEDFWYRTAIGVAEPWDTGGVLKQGGKLIIGAEIAAYSSFTGSLDDISIFNASVSDAEIESHSGGPVMKIDTKVLKDIGQGWIPITTPGDVIDGPILFRCDSTGKPIDTLEFYLSDTEPDLQNPDPNDWTLLSSYNNALDNYTDVRNTLDIPDNDSWYLICKATDDINNVVYDYYSTYFGINHFNELINFTYIDKNGHINQYSQIGVNPITGNEDHISSLKLFINYSNEVDYLANFSYKDLYSNYWLMYLDSLSNWIASKSLSPDEYSVNFIIEANLTYGNFPDYLHNYTLNTTVLDIKGPDLILLSDSPYSLVLGKTYDDPLENVVTMAINSTSNDFDEVKLEYKYETPTTASWVTYGTFKADSNSLADIQFDIINLRDDNITFRFIGYDNLDNQITLSDSPYYIVKNFNNHLEFSVEGTHSSILYDLDQENMIDLDLKIVPVDNDITKVTLTSMYEIFTLQNPLSEQDHIYFEDTGAEDIKLNSTYYNIFGSDFTTIPIEV